MKSIGYTCKLVNLITTEKWVILMEKKLLSNYFIRLIIIILVFKSQIRLNYNAIQINYDFIESLLTAKCVSTKLPLVQLK